MLALRSWIILCVFGLALGVVLRQEPSNQTVNQTKWKDPSDDSVCNHPSCDGCVAPPDDFGPPPHHHKLKKTALILIGGVSHLQGKGRDTYNMSTPFTPIRITGNALMKNIVGQNPNMDVIVHNWAYPLEKEFRKVFKPVQAKFQDFRELMPKFLEEAGGGNMNQISWSYSIKQAVNLMLAEENKTGTKYDAVIFFRPDVMLLKEMSIDEILKDHRKVYVENYHCGRSDIHFVMSRNNAVKFGKLYNWAKGRSTKAHQWVMQYINEGMKTYQARDSIYWTESFIYNWVKRVPRLTAKCYKLFEYGFTDQDAADLGFNCSSAQTRTLDENMEDLDISEDYLEDVYDY